MAMSADDKVKNLYRTYGSDIVAMAKDIHKQRANSPSFTSGELEQQREALCSLRSAETFFQTLMDYGIDPSEGCAIDTEMRTNAIYSRGLMP